MDDVAVAVVDQAPEDLAVAGEVAEVADSFAEQRHTLDPREKGPMTLTSPPFIMAAQAGPSNQPPCGSAENPVDCDS